MEMKMSELTCKDVGCRCIEDPVKLANENQKLRKACTSALSLFGAAMMTDQNFLTKEKILAECKKLKEALK